MAEKQKEFFDLPVEVLRQIFQFVGIHECVTELTKICTRRRGAIALHIMQPELKRLGKIKSTIT